MLTRKHVLLVRPGILRWHPAARRHLPALQFIHDLRTKIIGFRNLYLIPRYFQSDRMRVKVNKYIKFESCASKTPHSKTKLFLS